MVLIKCIPVIFTASKLRHILMIVTRMSPLHKPINFKLPNQPKVTERNKNRTTFLQPQKYDTCCLTDLKKTTKKRRRRRKNRLADKQIHLSHFHVHTKTQLSHF